MKTEEEARKCWCPFAAVSNQYGSSGHNRALKVRSAWHTEIAAEFLDATYCIASECMAWHAGDSEYDYAVTESKYLGFAVQIIRPDGEGWEQIPDIAIDFKAVRWYRPKRAGRGYCGLAGKP